MSKTESETIEYKKSLSELKEGLISIAAILNKHRHVELWFGIRNDGTVAGLVANEKTLRDIEPRQAGLRIFLRRCENSLSDFSHFRNFIGLSEQDKLIL
jgi:hypothetical protein